MMVEGNASLLPLTAWSFLLTGLVVLHSHYHMSHCLWDAEMICQLSNASFLLK